MEISLCHNPLALTGELPLWDDERKVLWWIDIQGQRLFSYSPENQNVQAFPVASQIGVIALGESGQLVLGMEDGLWLFSPEEVQFDPLCQIEAEITDNRLNDGKVDPYGRLWFGSMNRVHLGAPTGSLYCRDQEGKIHPAKTDIQVPNGICFSPDGRILYFTDSPRQKIYSYDLSADSVSLSNEKLVYEYEGDAKPDGICADTEGGLWVAVVGAGRVDRLHANGTLDFSISVPVSRPTMPLIGGPTNTTLFITSQRRFLSPGDLTEQPHAGGLMSVDVDFQGVPTHRIGGI